VDIRGSFRGKKESRIREFENSSSQEFENSRIREFKKSRSQEVEKSRSQEVKKSRMKRDHLARRRGAGAGSIDFESASR
jgi:hypothetical protein